MESLYKTNLTEKQYRDRFRKLNILTKDILTQLEKEEVTEEEARDKIRQIAKSQGLAVDESMETTGIISPNEIFGLKQDIRKSDYPKERSVIFPKQFTTVEERNKPCEIVKEPIVKTIMLNSLDYTNEVNRELYYSLCRTPKGIKVSSPAFGSKDAVRSERHKDNICQSEFGKKSKQIGAFHTHPGIGGTYFSPGDLSYYATYKNNPFNYNESQCVVSKNENKKGKKNVRIRCTTGVDADRFFDSIKYTPGEDVNRVVNRIGMKFDRDPNSQNAFSCIVDINNSKKKSFQNNYSSEYDGKIISKKQEKTSKRKQRKIFKKSIPKTESSGFLGLRSFI